MFLRVNFGSHRQLFTMWVLLQMINTDAQNMEDPLDDYDPHNIDYDLLVVTFRPLPEELLHEYENRTDYEVWMENCMRDFSLCKKYNAIKPTRVCAFAMNAVKEFFEFESICDLHYEKCKSKNDNIHYFHDGDCDRTKRRTVTNESLNSTFLHNI